MKVQVEQKLYGVGVGVGIGLSFWLKFLKCNISCYSSG